MTKKEMIEQIKKANDAYYNGGHAIMTDHEYDALKDALAAQEAKDGAEGGSPTEAVGAPVRGKLATDEHEYPALSLAKTKDVEEYVRAFGKVKGRKDVILMWKLDGSTLQLTYDNGKLKKAVTRGDGHTGQVILTADQIGGIPQTIPYQGHLVVRGEAVMSYSEFDRINESLPEGEKYANARNLANATITMIDTEEAKKRHIDFMAFQLVYAKELMDKPFYYRLTFLYGQGFGVCPLSVTTYGELAEEMGKWEAHVSDFDYPVDGLVTVLNDAAYAATLKGTGHHPHILCGYAFKWADEVAETTLDHIEWSCAQTAITPVAVFDPVNLEGTVVRRASLHNVSECRRLGVGGTGTKLGVIKANKIIPQVVSAETAGELEVPTVCPVCGAPTKIKKTNGTVEVLICTNPDCAAKNLKKLERFVSRDGMDIDGLSENTLADLVNVGLIQKPIDLYGPKLLRAWQKTGKVTLSDGSSLAEREGWGAKSIANLMQSIDASKQTNGAHFLYALSIPMCGHDVSKKLLAEYSVSELVDNAIEAAELGEMDRYAFIDGIGEEKSKVFVTWFQDDSNQAFVRDLLSIVSIQQDEQEEATCDGQTFVVTGAVSIFANRNALKDYVEKHGGKITGSVSKKTDYLIIEDPVGSTSSKAKKARELGITLLSEADFIVRFAPHLVSVLTENERDLAMQRIVAA